jgi:hypothetical protein
MKAHWFTPAVLLAVVTSPAQAQFAIDLTAGPNWTSISAAPIGFSKSSDIGYFVAGRIRFGHLLYVAPGLNYQYQSFIYNEGSTIGIEDNIGISSFMIPVEVGVNLNLKIVAVQLGIAGTVAFNTSINDNEFGVDKDMTTNTRWGYMLSASGRVLAFVLTLQWQQDLTNTFKGAETIGGMPAGDGKMSQFRLGFGVGF